MLIYAIKRKHDNKVVYVGQTVQTLQNRILKHRSDLKDQSRILYRAFKKYGFDYFYFDVLEDGIDSFQKLDERERFYISFFHTFPCGGGAYNMTDGGSNHCQLDPAYRFTLSESQRNRYKNPEERKKTGEIMRRVYAQHPELIQAKRIKNLIRYTNHQEHIKTSLATKAAFKKRPEIKQKIGRATRQRYIDNPRLRIVQGLKSRTQPCYIEARKRAWQAIRKKVVCVDTGEIFESITAAARQHSVKSPSILKAIKKGSRSKRYLWKFLDNTSSLM